MKIIQVTNILLTGKSNNIVFTLFPIMNKMSVASPALQWQTFRNIYLSLFFSKIYAFLGSSYG